MEVTIFFLLSSLFLDTWIQISNKSDTLIMKWPKIRKYDTGGEKKKNHLLQEYEVLN